MERNEITAEIDIMELDRERVVFRKEEGTIESRLQMLNAATTKTILDSIIESGDGSFDDDFAISLASSCGQNLLSSMKKAIEWYSMSKHSVDKKKLFESTLDFLRAYIDGTKYRYEPKEPTKKKPPKK